jgi:hypothetical protein
MLSGAHRFILGLMAKEPAPKAHEMKITAMVLGAVLVAPLTSLVGMSTAAPGEAIGGPTGKVTGYAYVCNGPVQVQEVKEYDGGGVIVWNDVEGPHLANGMFEVFQTSRPASCSAMAAPFAGAVPGTLLVDVAWGVPHLSVVGRRACLVR